MLSKQNTSQRRVGAGSVVALLAIAALALAAYWGGKQIWNSSSSDSADIDAILHEVARDDFVLSVTERGEVKSAGVTEIRSEVENEEYAGRGHLADYSRGHPGHEGRFSRRT